MVCWSCCVEHVWCQLLSVDALVERWPDGSSQSGEVDEGVGKVASSIYDMDTEITSLERSWRLNTNKSSLSVLDKSTRWTAAGECDIARGSRIDPENIVIVDSRVDDVRSPAIS